MLFHDFIRSIYVLPAFSFLCLGAAMGLFIGFIIAALVERYERKYGWKKHKEGRHERR